ncbi:hypothetical protein AA106556_1320 [Neokomagataea tanensis NBRC 106556]|uniref:Uncharacterized protein n=1 Tax=Neokomagataea tanensis NBRC 106556 TaxID=1223519 RepID=A0ABQ0QJK4_9PROT|nr:hypothetical protein AA106556_1320 [Neokomagataea tanensis NBRC 106556]
MDGKRVAARSVLGQCVKASVMAAPKRCRSKCANRSVLRVGRVVPVVVPEVVLVVVR